MRNEVRYIDCNDTKEQYAQTYLNDDRKSFKKTELELLSENLRKQIAQQKWENNNERIDLDEWIKQQVTSEQNAVFVTLKFRHKYNAEGAKTDIIPDKLIIDMSTSQPDLMIELNKLITKKGSFFADAPIARTRQAAKDGTLAIMVGSKKEVYKRILPILEYMGKDIMHCGDVGTGQMTKILNNMILFETVVALSEAANIAEKYDMSVKNLFENITKCSGDSFALRNHGLKSIAQNHFPSPAFSSEYALKDLSYAINLGKTHNLNLPGANSAKKLLKKSIMNGDKDLYFPVIKKHFG